MALRVAFFLIIALSLKKSFTYQEFEKKMSKTFFYEVFEGKNRKNSPVLSYQDTITKNILYKRNVHATYYHDKFNGRKTASGAIFDNNLLTAAHRKFKFGTKLKITNPINEKWVVVIVNDRGPFVKGREIDLTKKAFMEITDSSKKGSLNVIIEILKDTLL